MFVQIVTSPLQMPWPTQILLVETTGVPLELHNMKINETWFLSLSRHEYLDEFMLYHNLSKDWGCWPKRGSFQCSHPRQPKSPSAFFDCSLPPSQTSGSYWSHFTFHVQKLERKLKTKTSKQKPSSLPDQEMTYEKWFCKTVDSTCFSLSQCLLLPSQSTCRF